MKTMHKTREGFEILIADMTNEHLNSTIVGLAKQIHNTRLWLDRPDDMKVLPSTQILYKQAVPDRAKLEAALLRSVDNISAYTFEAALRGMDVSKPLQEAFGREGKITSTTPELPTQDFFQLP